MKEYKLCGNPAGVPEGGKKIKYGMICSSCYRRLPLGVRGNVWEFTGSQLKELLKKIKPAGKEGRCWVRYGGLLVCEGSIILNGIVYQLKDLESLRLNFHPNRIGTVTGTAAGILSLVITLKQPHLLVEEMLSAEGLQLRYYISGMEITYRYPDALDRALQCVSKAIAEGRHVIPEAVRYFDSFRSRGEKTGKKTREDSKAGKENGRELTRFEAAMQMFGLERPFTKEDLRKKRNQYITNNHIHPDDGGTEDAFRKVQEAFTLLSKFASDQEVAQ